VDHGLEAAEPINLVRHRFHFLKARQVADDHGLGTRRTRHRRIGARTVAAMQNYFMTLLDQELAAH
jgi:hypothetical protein